MRIAVLLPCLLLTACLATGEQPAPKASAVAAAPAADSSAAAGPARRTSGTRAGGSAAGGGATTSAAQAAEAAPPADDDRRDPLTRARVDCWMKVENEKGLRDINRRIAFVDKCVADTMKGKR